jgi:hypothetical protein
VQPAQNGHETVSLLYDRCMTCDAHPGETENPEYLLLGYSAERIIRTDSVDICIQKILTVLSPAISPKSSMQGLV